MKKSELKFEHFKEDIIKIPSYIPWKVVEEKMGKRMYKKFTKFMEGQTVSGDGVYPCDLRNFFSDSRFFD